ncbi:redoxin domain-containing protein [Candidatus Sumerlaeota bacterium]|nr:redoxin domain-containing protein [Candidatus Sumerlaeota bacterium]
MAVNFPNRILAFILFIACAILLPTTRVAAENPSDFSLKAVTGPEKGKEFKLSEARGHFVALHFLLKTECPFCIKHTRSYLENADKVAGVQHVFIKPDTEEEITAWAGKVDPKSLPVIYRDPDAGLADQFAITGGYSFHKQSVHYPALVILDPTGKEVFRYIGKSNTDRYSFENFEKKMNELTTPKDGSQNVDKEGIAIGGYDPVSYLKAGTATKGEEKLTSSFCGAKYQFATEENRAMFAENPGKYVPAYGGWCATGVAHGVKKQIDPTLFKVTDGRTYLFYKGEEGNGKDFWLKDEAGERRKADAEWEKMSSK